MANAVAAVVMAVGNELAWAIKALARADCDTPRLDAELLLAEVLRVDRARLVMEARRALTFAEAVAFGKLIARRIEREPVAYILGRKEFRAITLGVDRRVLIPRPETELLVEVGLGLPAGALVADVGTGSGAVALALKHERPDLIVRGLDLDSGALELARANAVALGLEVEFAQADLLDGERYHAVLANLPYVPGRTELAPEIARYEPAGALFAGADGLDLIRRLVLGVSPDVELLALEIGGSEQGVAVAALVKRVGFGDIEVLRDLAGLERVIVGRR